MDRGARLLVQRCSPTVGPMSWSGSPQPCSPPSGCSGTAPAPWSLGKGRLHPHIHATIPAFIGTPPCTSHCRAGVLVQGDNFSPTAPHLPSGPLWKHGGAASPPRDVPGVLAGHAACTEHTQRRGEQHTMGRRVMDTAQGPEGQQQDGHPGLTLCPPEGQGLLQEEEEKVG